MTKDITITKEMIKVMEAAVDTAFHDGGDKIIIEMGPHTGRSTVYGLEKDIIKLGLKELAIKSQYQKLDLYMGETKSWARCSDGCKLL